MRLSQLIIFFSSSGVEQVASPALVDPSSSHQEPPSGSASICPALFAPFWTENGTLIAMLALQSAKCQGVKAICVLTTRRNKSGVNNIYIRLLFYSLYINSLLRYLSLD